MQRQKFLVIALIGLCLVLAMFATAGSSRFSTSANGGTSDSGSAVIAYDSGWVNITGMQGQNITITDGLNIANWDNSSVIIEVTGMTSPNGAILRYLGLSEVAVGWSKTYGGTSYDEGHYGMVQTSDGGFAMAGETWSFGSGGADFYLVRTDARGNMLWQKAYGDSSDDKCYDMIQTSDGGFALTGYTMSYGAGGQDMWLVKTDANGNVEWNQTYGGKGDECALSLIQTTDGGYALAGYTTSYGAGNMDFWLVKIDGSGNARWNMTYGGPEDDYARSVIQTSDGGYLIGGYTESYGTGGLDAWLVKTDANGVEQWNQTYGGSGDDQAMQVMQTADGGYVFCGRTTSFGAGGSDGWLVSVDQAGNELWNKTYGGMGNDVLWKMVQTSDGGYAMVGYTNSFGAGDYDYWLVKTDSSGNELWNKTYGGPAYDEARSLVQTSDGGYALSGRTYSFGAGLSDVWLVKVDASGNLNGETGLVWTDSSANTITLYRGGDDSNWNYVRVRILMDPPVQVTGDVNGDGRVDMKDIALVARAFGFTPASPNWNPAADINGDGIVNMKDIALVARNFAQHL